MPIWLVDMFGSAQLNAAFWFIGLMTLPLWLLMLLLPDWKVTRPLVSPFLFPVLFCGVLFYVSFKAYTLTGVPVPDHISQKSARVVVSHPTVFLVFWCQYQIVNLFVGTVIYKEAKARKLTCWPELILTWLSGPVGLVVFATRLLVSRR